MLNKINEILQTPFTTKTELLEYYRNCLPGRIGDFRLEEVGPIMSIGSSEEINGYLHNSFYFNGLGIDMGNQIDWYGTPNGDLEWNGGFVRHGHFMYLADAYEATQDEKYASAIINQMLDYIRNIKPYEPDGQPYLEYKKSTWRPFEVAGRAAENWPVALAKIIKSSSMTPTAFAEIFYSIYEHAVFLSKHHWRTGNHACLEVAGLGVMSIFYSEFAQARHWRDYSIGFLMQMLDEEFYPDGYTMEMSGAYHWVALRNFFAYYQVALNNKMQYIFPTKYIQVITKAAWAEYYQQKPDFSLPVTNDSNVTTCHKKNLESLACLLPPEVIEYRLSNGTRGTPPPHISYMYDSAHIAVMRSSWQSNAVYGFFDMGDWGTNHMNEDQLCFELSAYGRNLLVNSGRWRYTTSPCVQWLAQAQYFKTTAAYNSVTCNNLCQMPENASGKMNITDNYDYACGKFSGGYGEDSLNDDEEMLKTKGLTGKKICTVPNATHVREIFFAKPDFFIIRDRISGKDVKSAQQIWHTACDNAFVNKNIAYSNYNDANFIIIQLTEVKTDTYCGSLKPFKGWHCPKYDDLQKSIEIVYEQATTEEIIFETLIYPINDKVDPNNLPHFSKKSTDETTIYEVSFNGKCKKIAAYDGDWRLLQ